MLIDLPLPQATQHHLKKSLPRHSYLPWREKTAHKDNYFAPALYVTLWVTLLWSHGDSRAISGVQPLLQSHCYGEEARAFNTQHSDVDTRNSYLQCPRKYPNCWFCSFAELSHRCTLSSELGQGSGGGGSALLRFSNEKFCWS